ncbi:MAG: DUF3365 domain-containing protein [Rhodocyclaceae bacterium]|nr:DUF3365 domain-containing protein [Rhodocyclaceae bacterium]
MRTLLIVTLLAAAGAVRAGELESLTAETRAEVAQILPRVSGMMKSAVEAEGVAAAIPVCKDKAPQLMAEKADALGWKIRRVSLKTRNPERATPDAWEAERLAAFDARAAAGEAPASLEVAEIVSDGEGRRVFRYMKALPVAPVCVQCHGEQANMAPELVQALARDYPHDAATGYAPGQIRGAVTVQRPL